MRRACVGRGWRKGQGRGQGWRRVRQQPMGRSNGSLSSRVAGSVTYRRSQNRSGNIIGGVNARWKSQQPWATFRGQSGRFKHSRGATKPITRPPQPSSCFTGWSSIAQASWIRTPRKYSKTGIKPSANFRHPRPKLPCAIEQSGKYLRTPPSVVCPFPGLLCPKPVIPANVYALPYEKTYQAAFPSLLVCFP